MPSWKLLTALACRPPGGARGRDRSRRALGLRILHRRAVLHRLRSAARLRLRGSSSALTRAAPGPNGPLRERARRNSFPERDRRGAHGSSSGPRGGATGRRPLRPGARGRLDRLRSPPRRHVRLLFHERVRDSAVDRSPRDCGRDRPAPRPETLARLRGGLRNRSPEQAHRRRPRGRRRGRLRAHAAEKAPLQPLGSWPEAGSRFSSSFRTSCGSSSTAFPRSSSTGMPRS